METDLSFQDKVKIAIGWLLVKCGHLKFDAFSIDELEQFLTEYFPQTLDVDVPVGKAKLICQNATLVLNQTSQRVELNVDALFEVKVLGNPIYRAHIAAKASALARYDRTDTSVYIEDVQIDNLKLIADEYSLVKDTSYLLQDLTAVGLAQSIGTPIKSALYALTGGIPHSATNLVVSYLNNFTHGNKQRLLDEHTPAIENAMLTKLQDAPLVFEMRNYIWRENLFSRLGKRVCIEQEELRFYFE